MSRSTIRIAIVGAGPKAAAIVAKAHAMNHANEDTGEPVFAINVFDRTGIAANWGGGHGYTDGQAVLCTLAERDVGFPYRSENPRVDVLMHQRFSWGAFLVHDRAYGEWVSGGRERPTHERFAEYLNWVFLQAGNEVAIAEVTRLSAQAGKWTVEGSVAGTVKQLGTDYDGVVITNPGPATGIPLSDPSNPPSNLFNGENFWKNLDRAREILNEVEGPEVLIVGGGGTAAAVISWLVRNGFGGAVIQMVAPQPTLFSRTDNSFENRLYTEEDYWGTLTPEMRDDTFARLNRGVVWDAVISDIRKVRLKPTSGKAVEVSTLPTGMAEVKIVQSNNDETSLVPDLVVDGTGFNAAWYEALVSEPMLNQVEWKMARRQMGDGLELRGAALALPPLHVPLDSSQVGPGFGSLMVLGAMAERILQYHIRPPLGP